MRGIREEEGRGGEGEEEGKERGDGRRREGMEGGSQGGKECPSYQSTPNITYFEPWGLCDGVGHFESRALHPTEELHLSTP